MHRPDDNAESPRNPPRRKGKSHEPPARTPPPPEPDKSVPPPTVEFLNKGPRAPLPGPPLVRKERFTYHIRFRRGWFGRLVVQVELAVHWYELLNPKKGPVKSDMEWRDANKDELEEIARGYFQPE